MFELLGISLALAIFLAVHTIAVVAAAISWSLARRRAGRWSARTQAEVVFALRLAPVVLAAMVVVLFFVPAYLSHEPRNTPEPVSLKLAIFAILSSTGLAFAMWRAGRTWVATAALRRQWTSASRAVQLPGIQIPTFRMAHRFPVIAVVGMFRPRLFIAEQVFASLQPDELAAAVTHEYGHLRARDNIKRGLLRACRDALIVPFGSSLDRAWAEAAEAAADEFAGETSPKMALSLAAALVAVARMVPNGARPEMPLAAFLVGIETGGIKGRVRRLLEIASTGGNRKHTSMRLARMLPFVSLTIALVMAALLASNAQVRLNVHLAVERFVYLLS